VAHGAPADVRLGDLGDRDRRLHACHGADLLERVLQRERVQDGREHAHVVAGGAVHAGRRPLEAAVDVPAADHDRDLHAAVGDELHLSGDCGDPLRVRPVREVPHEGLPRELEQDAPEGGFGHSPPTWKRANLRITTFSPVFAASSVRSSPIVFDSCLSSFTCLWSSRTTSSSHLFRRPSTIFSWTFSGLPSEAACSRSTRSSASFASSSTSSRDTNCAFEAATCRATSRAKAWNSSVRATKSVSQSTSTSAPILPPAWM